MIGSVAGSAAPLKVITAAAAPTAPTMNCRRSRFMAFIVAPAKRAVNASRPGRTVLQCSPDGRQSVPKLDKKRNATPRVRRAIPARKVQDPPGESFHDLVNAAARWSARHDLLKLARKAFHSPLNDLPAGQIELSVERQCVVFATADHESHS